jgi:endonuclease YncB( thermonuclease family)
MKKNHLTILITSIIGILILSSVFYLIYKTDYKSLPDNTYVSQVIDGDTFQFSNGKTIRLLCVDTPEQAQQGFSEAVSFLEAMILYEEIEISDAAEVKKDKYKRDLAFVYVNRSGEKYFVNEEILRLGFGEFYELVDGECDILKNYK